MKTNNIDIYHDPRYLEVATKENPTILERLSWGSRLSTDNIASHLERPKGLPKSDNTDIYHDPRYLEVAMKDKPGLLERYSWGTRLFVDNYNNFVEEPLEERAIPEEISRWGRIKDILYYTAKDVVRAKRLGKLSLIALGAITAYEWGIGNEVVTPLLVGQVLDQAKGLGGVALVAAVGGLFTFGEQALSAKLANNAVDDNPRLANRMFEHMQGDESEELKHKPFNKLSPIRKLLYSLSLGSSFNVMREAYAVGETNKDKLKKIGRMSAAISGVTVAAIGAGIEVANQYYADNEKVQTFLDWTIKNEWFWPIVMTALFTGGYLYNKRKNKKEAQANAAGGASKLDLE